MARKNKAKKTLQNNKEHARIVIQDEEELTSSMQPRLLHSKQSPLSFPLPFPSSIKHPRDLFLRKEHGSAFSIALKTSCM
mmetsp:Transcript_30734/g.46599  ORF Transcript_30734/g.46599 Transcript_30734/m.46599 type:complete len:80 (+) Transcript_30734:526-765(+)